MSSPSSTPCAGRSTSSYDDIMENAGMDHQESALILAELVSGGVIGQA